MRQLLALGSLLLVGCIAPPGPVERLSNAAYEMNSATRFGRMDVAVAHVQPALQDDFMKRHAGWHRALRIVDVELNGLRLITPETAEVSLAISWHRPAETSMRTSMVAQKWTRHDGDWTLSEELCVAGSRGLFAEVEDDGFDPADAPARVDPPPLGQITTDGWQ